MTTQEKVDYFRDLLSTQGNINILCFDRERHPIGVIDKNTTSLIDIFRASGCEEEMYQHGEHSDMPLSLGTAVGLLWNAVYEKEDGILQRVYIIGPVFITEITEAEFAQKLAQSAIPTEIKIKLLDLRGDIPQIPQARHSYHVIMLHYCVTRQRITLNDIKSSSVDMYSEQRRENGAASGYGLLKLQKKLQANITAGNINYYKDFEKAKSFDGVHIDINDPVRYAKDVAIVFTALCTEAAIQGGMYPSLAFAARSSYIGKLERSRSSPAVAAIIDEMYDGFVQAVHHGKKAASSSAAVQKCCDYIYANLQRKITVAELAELVNYSPEHLSRVFSKEMGISIKQYIEDAKIESVAGDLIHTELSIRELAELYGYCSVSHMGKAFQKKYGMTPTAYRKENNSIKLTLK